MKWFKFRKKTKPVPVKKRRKSKTRDLNRKSLELDVKIARYALYQLEVENGMIQQSYLLEKLRKNREPYIV